MKRSAPGSVVLTVLVYRWLLHLYPRTFRQRFGHEMVQVFRTTCQESWRRGGGWEILVLMMETAPDVMMTATKERLRRGRTAWEETMASGLWDRLGGIMALVAIGITITVTVFGFGRWDIPMFSGGELLNGVQLLSRIMIVVVIGVVLRAQRTRMGQAFGSIALVGTGLHLLLVDVELSIPLLNQHPHLLSMFISTGGPTAALSLIGGIGLGATTVRYRELEGWNSKPLLWRRWSIIGGSVGFLIILFHRPQTNLLAFLLIEGAFIVVPTWAFLAGTALGLLRSSLHAHSLSEMPQTSNTV